jgi:hypothetical protein
MGGCRSGRIETEEARGRPGHQCKSQPDDEQNEPYDNRKALEPTPTHAIFHAQPFVAKLP